MNTKATSLSGDEVAALMAELGDASSAFEADRDAVIPFALGAEDAIPTSRLAGLNRIGERMTRKLRAEVESYTRAKTLVTIDPIEGRRYEDWLADQRDFTALNLYRARPLKGSIMLAIEAEFVTSLVDAFYGGRGGVPQGKKSEFTPSEERLLDRFANMIIGVMRDCWSETVPMETSFVQRETNPDHINLVRDDEMVIVQRITFVPAQGRAGIASIIYPQVSLRPIESLLSAKIHEDEGPVDPEWRNRMAGAMGNVRIPVRSILARPEITVRQLMTLKVGDVIPINIPGRVPLLAGKTNIAEGTIGEQDGRASILIEKIGRGTGK